MTALESLKAEISDLKASVLALLGKSPKAEIVPEPEMEEEEPEITIVVEGDPENKEDETDPEKEKVSAALTKLNGLEAAFKSQLDIFKAELKTENDTAFEMAVSKAAATLVNKGGVKPLAKNEDAPAQGKTATVDAVTGLDRVQAAMAKKRNK